MSIFKPVSWGVALLAVAFIAVGSYAYASPSVTKGDALYSWKTSFERMKVRGADTQLEKVQVYSALALRRLAEAKVLARESGTISLPGAVSLLHIPVANAETVALNGVEAEIADGETVTFLISTLGEVTLFNETAIEEAEDITDPTELQDALEVIDATQAESLEGLEEVAGEVGTEASEELLDAVAVALDETAQDAAEVDAALDDVAAALESGDTEVSVDVETSADLAAAADDEDGNEAADETPDENAVKLEVAQQTIATFKVDLLSSGVSEEEAQKLFDRVDAKLLKAQEALEDGNVNKMNGLLKATTALTNYAKHFAKQKKQEPEEDTSNPSDASDQNEDADEADEVDADEASGADEAVNEDEAADDTSDDSDTSQETSAATDVSVETEVDADVSVQGRGNGSVNVGGVGRGLGKLKQ